MILVFGENGQIAQTLKTLRPDLHFVSSRALDLENTTEIPNLLNQWKPKVVINAAAYTAVDKAEGEVEKAFLINAAAPREMAQWCKKNSALLIHFSTDYVFDGEKKSSYFESDTPRPINVYGQSKLAGEQEILAVNGPHFIFRTSWVFSPFGNNFLKTMIRLGQEKETLNIVGDQLGAPTYTFELVKNILPLIEKYEHWLSHPEAWGIYHLAGKDNISWFHFAEKIFSRVKHYPVKIKLQNLTSITMKDYPTPARRPLNSQLDLSKFKKLNLSSFNSLDENINDCLRRIYGNSNI